MDISHVSPVALYRCLSIICVTSMVAMATRTGRDNRFSFNDVRTNSAADVQSQVAIDPYTHHRLPVLKMLKRQIRNFRTNLRKNATVTLVYHAQTPVDMHWFKVEQTENEDIVYPILQDHPYYQLREFRSGDVTAVTLIIPPTKHDRAHVFETVLTIHEPMMQYQIKSTLDSRLQHKRENIDSPEWLVVPKDVDHIDKNSFFERHCRAYVKRYNGGNSLVLMRAAPVAPGLRFKPDFRSVFRTHDEGMQDVGEATGSLVLEGTLTPLSRFKAVLDVKATQSMAHSSRQGFYMCTVERDIDAKSNLDKLSLLSYSTFGDNKSLTSLVPTRPRVQITTCGTNYDQLVNDELILKMGSLGCVKCRGFGYPLPQVNITRTGDTIGDLAQAHSRLISAISYVNVVEGGVVEAIYVIYKPRKSLIAQYDCVASNLYGERSHTFSLKVVKT